MWIWGDMMPKSVHLLIKNNLKLPIDEIYEKFLN